MSPHEVKWRVIDTEANQNDQEKEEGEEGRWVDDSEQNEAISTAEQGEFKVNTRASSSGSERGEDEESGSCGSGKEESPDRASESEEDCLKMSLAKRVEHEVDPPMSAAEQEWEVQHLRERRNMLASAVRSTQDTCIAMIGQKPFDALRDLLAKHAAAEEDDFVENYMDIS
eukprot:1289761-Pyramimonas_sp.AAC.1